MKNFKNTTLALAAMLACGTTAFAQDNVEANVSADIVSNYIWRGAKLDNAAIQPTLGVSYKGLSLTAWGSYGLTDPNMKQEFDLTLAYSTGNFNVGITDYYADGDRYLYYNSHSTSHTFEANVGYDFGALSVQWFTNFAGADGTTEKGKRAYTSYVELNAPFALGGLDWNATLGCVPYSACNGFYETNTTGSFAVTNIALKASKDIKVTDSFSIPAFAQIVANPSTQKSYFVVGFTLKP